MKRRFSQLMYLLIICTLVFGQPAIASSPRLPTVLRPSSAVRSAGTFESPLPQPPPTPPVQPPAGAQPCATAAADDVVLQVSFAAPAAPPGQEAALSWTVLNCRPANLEGTQLTYIIPQGFTLSPQDVPAPLSYNPNTRTVSGSLPSLAAGATLTAQFPLRATGLRAGVPMLSHGDEALDAVRAAEGVAEAGAKGARKIAGLLPAPKLQNHHIFPQHWKDWFRAPGCNIDIDKSTVELSEKTHLSGVHGKGGFVAVDDIELSGRWNARWEEFISKNPNATAKEVGQFAGGLMDESGLSGLDIVAYPK